jgi:hypothetical protein
VEKAAGGKGPNGAEFDGKASFETTLDGYTLIRSKENPSTILLVLDYDGTIVESPGIPPARDLHNFMTMSPGQIRRFYEAQYSE